MENESRSPNKSCIQIYRLVEAVFPAASSLRRRIFIGATHPWGLGTPLTLKFLVGEFVHLSSLFELLYYICSLRHQPSHEIFLALSTNTNSKYSGGTKYKYTLFRGPSTKYKYAFFRGSEHQIQIHIIQGVQKPNKNTHFSGGPIPNTSTHYSGAPGTK